MQLLVQFLEVEVFGKELAFRKSSHPISGKQVKAGYRRSASLVASLIIN